MEQKQSVCCTKTWRPLKNVKLEVIPIQFLMDVSLCKVEPCGIITTNHYFMLIMSLSYILGFPSAGHIRFDTVGVSITYSYDTIENNRNDRTLAMFSTQANKKMRPCGSCDLFAEYKRFYQYYGQYDYAHQWVMSAFEQTRITFDSSVSDFTLYSLESRGSKYSNDVDNRNISMCSH